jgi:2,4-dichlorophenol 6-monooxygenase
MAIAEAFGLSPDAGAEANWRQLRRVWSDRAEDVAHRRRVRRAVASQSMEFREHNVEYGYTYQSAAIVCDGSPAPDPVDAVRVYEASTRPGSPLPHAWVEDDAGARHSLLDLVRPGRFLLLGAERAQAWCEAARRIAGDRGLPLDAVTVGHLDGDYLDPRCQWMRQRGIDAEGAVLVRPDRFVAWRCTGGPSDAMNQLGSALSRILHGGAA